MNSFFSIMEQTGQRDDFGVHSLDYYQQAFDLFNPPGMCELFIAKYQEEVLGGLMVFSHGGRAWYFYGASSNAHRNLMPNYLLQWEAMKWAKTKGCESYDLWGVPDEDENILEANFSQRSDGLWGVYRFKRGFGGQVKRSIPAWDHVYNPLIYRFYQLWTDQ
jgi:lipid II:glycine glycyltransferase (peptidoglycan interpeptide bridge formation enzyme)